MNRRAAAIDIGSNSLRLLVAQLNPTAPRVTPLFRDMETVRLGQGMSEHGVLQADRIAAAIKCLRRFARLATEWGADEIRAVATSAVRDAANGDDFVAQVRRSVGIDVTILTGDGEAELTFAGLVEGLPVQGTQDSIGMIDIGGRSTEVVCGSATGMISHRISLPAGAVRMTESFLGPGPNEPQELHVLMAYLDALFAAPVKKTKQVAGGGDLRLFGVGGTITSLAAMDQAMATYDPARIHGYVLPRLVIGSWVERVAAMTAEQRREIIGLQLQRADIILAGLVILNALCEGINANDMVVSEAGILYGALLRGFGGFGTG